MRASFIVAHIDAETVTIDALVGKYERELELLDEYRASLITVGFTLEQQLWHDCEPRNELKPRKSEIHNEEWIVGGQ
ncbi:hypothetical protein GC173_02155 [bacterium]|nr:hypothetical protein [bacterium]